MQESKVELLSDFYTALWSHLDALFDEHRWLRAVGETRDARTAEEILSELKSRQLTPSIPLQRLQQESSQVADLAEEWKAADKKKRVELRSEIEAKRSYLQDKALAFGVLITEETTT